MKKKAFAAMDMLIWLLVTIAIFMVCIISFNHIKFKTNKNDEQTLKEHINSQITEIENARHQAAEFEKELLDDME